MCDFFFFNDTATTEIYTLSLHDALPIFGLDQRPDAGRLGRRRRETDVAPHSSRQAGVVGDLGPVLAAVGGLEQAAALAAGDELPGIARSDEHTSELQSQSNLVCRLLPVKKNALAATSDQ